MWNEQWNLVYDYDGNIGPFYGAVEEKENPNVYEEQQGPSRSPSDIGNDKGGGE